MNSALQHLTRVLYQLAGTLGDRRAHYFGSH
jgi:hypothetical protein